MDNYKANKGFYEILWEICQKDNHITRWILDGYLVKSKDTFFWTPKAMQEFECNIVGELKIENPDLSTIKLEKPKKAPQMSFEDNKLAEFIELFGRKNIGIPGKGTPKITVVKKLINFFNEYPEYTMDDVIGATKLYIANLKKQGSIRFIRECGYFISKKIDGVDQSDLAKWCEEYKQGGQSFTDYTSHNLL
jgi:hypothetical protein